LRDLAKTPPITTPRNTKGITLCIEVSERKSSSTC